MLRTAHNSGQSQLYQNREQWNRMALVNIAKVGRFAADRSIQEYAQHIWDAQPVVFE